VWDKAVEQDSDFRLGERKFWCVRLQTAARTVLNLREKTREIEIKCSLSNSSNPRVDNDSIDREGVIDYFNQEQNAGQVFSHSRPLKFKLRKNSPSLQ
jgi:hypothetical protein